MILSGVLAAGTAVLNTPPADAPDAELLEFLGSYETANGKWVDPTTLDGDAAKPASRATAEPAPPPAPVPAPPRPANRPSENRP